MARFRIDPDLQSAVVLDRVSLTMPRARRRQGQGTRHRLRRLAGEASREQVRVLDTVSLSVEPGQSVAILSDDGEGCVELLRLAAGTLIPDEGVVSRRACVVPMLDDSRCLDATYTVRQNIYVVGSLLGMAPDLVTSRLKWITDMAGAGGVLDAYLRDTPKNLRQRLVWATTLATQADIFAIEESVVVGKDEVKERCWDYMESLRAAGTTFIVTAGDAEILIRFCDRAIVLRDGRIAADTSIEQALTMVRLHHKRHVRLEAPDDDDEDVNPVV
jgi:ABC-type polysaccharide/polyol phosphate transport system ATPase subunit